MKKIAMPRTLAVVERERERERERESYTLLNGKKQLNLIELNKLII